MAVTVVLGGGTPNRGHTPAPLHGALCNPGTSVVGVPCARSDGIGHGWWSTYSTNLTSMPAASYPGAAAGPAATLAAAALIHNPRYESRNHAPDPSTSTPRTRLADINTRDTHPCRIIQCNRIPFHVLIRIESVRRQRCPDDRIRSQKRAGRGIVDPTSHVDEVNPVLMLVERKPA